MADGGLKLELNEALSRELIRAADQAGVPVGDLATGFIARGLTDRWSISLARLAEYDRTGEFVEAETAIREFEEALRAALKAKRQ